MASFADMMSQLAMHQPASPFAGPPQPKPAGPPKMKKMLNKMQSPTPGVNLWQYMKPYLQNAGNAGAPRELPRESNAFGAFRPFLQKYYAASAENPMTAQDYIDLSKGGTMFYGDEYFPYLGAPSTIKFTPEELAQLQGSYTPQTPPPAPDPAQPVPTNPMGNAAMDSYLDYMNPQPQQTPPPQQSPPPAQTPVVPQITPTGQTVADSNLVGGGYDAAHPYGPDGSLGPEDLGSPFLSPTDQQYLAGYGLTKNPYDYNAWTNAYNWKVPGVMDTWAEWQAMYPDPNAAPQAQAPVNANGIAGDDPFLKNTKAKGSAGFGTF